MIPLAKVGLRIILSSGQSVVRACTETEARQLIDLWIEGNERTIGSVIGSSISDVWCVHTHSIAFLDIIDLEQFQAQSAPPAYPRAYNPLGTKAFFNSGGSQW